MSGTGPVSWGGTGRGSVPGGGIADLRYLSAIAGGQPMNKTDSWQDQQYYDSMSGNLLFALPDRTGPLDAAALNAPERVSGPVH